MRSVAVLPCLTQRAPKDCRAVPELELHYCDCHGIFISLFMRSHGQAAKWEERTGLLKA